MPATLETERLTLRPFALEDAGWWRVIRGHPAVVRFLPPLGPDAEADARERIAAFVRHWDERGYGTYAVVEKASGRPIGHHGLRFLSEFGETEALWTLDPAVHGRGYATEAGRAVVAHAFAGVGLARLIAITTADNLASRRVMEKLGFSYEKPAQFRGVEVLYHSLESPPIYPPN
jgi:ribosomal-protein-alanine N-acetyltransferase